MIVKRTWRRLPGPRRRSPVVGCTHSGLHATGPGHVAPRAGDQSETGGPEMPARSDREMATLPVAEDAKVEPIRRPDGQDAGPAPDSAAGYAAPVSDAVRPVRNVLSRFPPGPRSIWKGVSESLWNDWHWQQRERVTRVAQLEKVLRLTADERRAAIESQAEFRMGITPY